MGDAPGGGGLGGHLKVLSQPSSPRQSGLATISQAGSRSLWVVGPECSLALALQKVGTLARRGQEPRATAEKGRSVPALRGGRSSGVSTASVLMVRLQSQNLTGLKVPSRPSLSLSGTLGRIPSGSPPPPSDSHFWVFLLPPKTLCMVDLQSLSWRPSGSPEVPWTAPPRSGPAQPSPPARGGPALLHP